MDLGWSARHLSVPMDFSRGETETEFFGTAGRRHKVCFFKWARAFEFQTGPFRFSYKTIETKSLSDWNAGWFSVADLFTVSM